MKKLTAISGDQNAEQSEVNNDVLIGVPVSGKEANLALVSACIGGS